MGCWIWGLGWGDRGVWGCFWGMGLEGLGVEVLWEQG